MTEAQDFAKKKEYLEIILLILLILQNNKNLDNKTQ